MLPFAAVVVVVVVPAAALVVLAVVVAVVAASRWLDAGPVENSIVPDLGLQLSDELGPDKNDDKLNNTCMSSTIW